MALVLFSCVFEFAVATIELLFHGGVLTFVGV